MSVGSSDSASASPMRSTNSVEVKDETMQETEKVRRRDKNACLKFLIDNWFMLSTVAGVCLGFGLAFTIRATQPGPTAITWIAMPADVYLRLLQLTILPLIASNLVIAIAGLNFRKDGKIGIIGILYIILINLFCAIVGTVSSLLIKPGSRVFTGNTNNTAASLAAQGLTASDVFRDVIYNLFPDNIVGVTMFHFQTEFDATTNKTISVSNKDGTNMVGVLFCSIVFGAAAKATGNVSKPFVDFFTALSVIVTKIMSVFLLMTPVAVCFMVTSSVVGRENIESDFIQLGLFVVTVITALAIHFFAIVFVYFVASRRNPLRLLKYSSDAFVLAFATTSPALALPETYLGLDKFGVSQRVTRLLGPLAATLKGDGPAAFITSSVVFVAQQAKIDLNVGQIISVVFLTFTSSLAVPNIPSASIVLVVTILSSIGVPSEGAGLLFAMEWLLDRCRSGSGALSMMYLPATVEAICNRMQKDPEDVESLESYPEDYSIAMV
uniref:Amino acid transporter n=1 Tax=Mesocestoides corti TaxID=53468 RepID=A0A5K3EW21_MESCO